MSVNQKINRIISRNTRMGVQAQQAGKILASFIANKGKDEFAIDYLYRYAYRLIEHPSKDPISDKVALSYVEESVDPNYKPEIKVNGITEARILTYAMETGLMLNAYLEDPEIVLAIMAAMIDVATRVDALNKTSRVNDAWKVGINKALGITARTGYRKARAYDPLILDPYSFALEVAGEAMNQIDGESGEYGLQESLLKEIFQAIDIHIIVAPEGIVFEGFEDDLFDDEPEPAELFSGLDEDDFDDELPIVLVETVEAPASSGAFSGKPLFGSDEPAPAAVIKTIRPSEQDAKEPAAVVKTIRPSASSGAFSGKPLFDE